jgi:hypothetical protein
MKDVADALTEWPNLHVDRHCFGCADGIEAFPGRCLQYSRGLFILVEITPVITSRRNVRIRQLFDVAKAKGAKLTQFPGVRSKAYSAETIISATVIEDLNDSHAILWPRSLRADRLAYLGCSARQPMQLRPLGINFR